MDTDAREPGAREQTRAHVEMLEHVLTTMKLEETPVRVHDPNSSFIAIRMSGSGNLGKNQMEEQQRLQVNQSELMMASCYCLSGGEWQPDPQRDHRAGEGLAHAQRLRVRQARDGVAQVGRDRVGGARGEGARRGGARRRGAQGRGAWVRPGWVGGV